jgi:hypothetical protein
MMTDDDSSISKQVSCFNVEHAMVVADSSKRQVRPPMDHFEKLLEETFLNHTYHIKHKLGDCGMMKSFMTSGFLS